MEAAVLAGFERQKQAARAQREQAEAARAKAAEAARHAEEAEERARNHREATRLLKLGGRRVPSRTNTGASPSASGGGRGAVAARGSDSNNRSGGGGGARKESLDQRDRKRERAQREGRDPVKEERSYKESHKKNGGKGVAKRKNFKPRHDPSKPLPGMEFVERRHKGRPVVVPSTLDYSDMFPESLIGSEIEPLTKTRAATAAAAETNRQIYDEKVKMHDELQRVAKLDKKDNGRRVSEITWVAVERPTALTEQGPSPGKASRGASTNTPSFPLSKKAKSEIDRKQLTEATAAKSKALFDLINQASGPASSGSTTVERRKYAPSAERHHVSPTRGPRKRPRESIDSSVLSGKRPRRTSTRGEESETSDDRPPIKDRGAYSDSDDFSDYDDDDDDDDDGLTGFEALQAEELRSAKIAAREDLREKQRLEKAKLEKKRRRLEWERKNSAR
jgi:SPT2 chromatin protein